MAAIALPCLLGFAAFGSPGSASAASANASKKTTYNLPGSGPHLLAHYMPWFQTDQGPQGAGHAWDHWKYTGNGPQHDPEKRRSNGFRDIAAVQYPLIGVYDSRSRAVVRYHLRTARAAGIEGIVVDWYGRSSYTDQQVPLLLDEAAQSHMRVALCYEEKINFLWRPVNSRQEAVSLAAADLKYLVARYGSHRAYLRRNGRPVILNFDGAGQGKIGPNLFSPAEFQQILRELGGPVAYCRQGLTDGYYPPIPGAFQWWSRSPRELHEFGERARRMVNERKLEFFGGMMSPGFDDSGVWGWGAGARVTPSGGLSFLRHTFDASCIGAPEFVQIVTWNDFNEGTAIEPTRETGYQVLDAIATWWAARRKRKPDLDAIRRPFLEYVRQCNARERAELPSSPYGHYLDHRSLAVAIPGYLDYLAEHNGSR